MPPGLPSPASGVHLFCRFALSLLLFQLGIGEGELLRVSGGLLFKLAVGLQRPRAAGGSRAGARASRQFGRLDWLDETRPMSGAILLPHEDSRRRQHHDARIGLLSRFDRPVCVYTTYINQHRLRMDDTTMNKHGAGFLLERAVGRYGGHRNPRIPSSP